MKNNEAYIEFCEKQKQENPEVFTFWKKLKYLVFGELILFVVYEIGALSQSGQPSALAHFGIAMALVAFVMTLQKKHCKSFFYLNALLGLISILINVFVLDYPYYLLFTFMNYVSIWFGLIIWIEVLLPVISIVLLVWISLPNHQRLLQGVCIIQEQRTAFLKDQASTEKQ